MKKTYYKSPVGVLEVCESENHITALSIVKETPDTKSDSSPLLEEAIKQLNQYFTGERTDFDLPLKQTGTLFEQKAWDYLLTIPYGKTVSYKDEAEAIGSPKAFRAAGSANGKNNIAIIVPCHRVINCNSKLGGYAYGLDVKVKLLELEAKFVK